MKDVWYVKLDFTQLMEYAHLVDLTVLFVFLKQSAQYVTMDTTLSLTILAMFAKMVASIAVMNLHA
jgi:hypothetical protein